jgi:putative hydrolase of the HAD superfamily
MFTDPLRDGIGGIVLDAVGTLIDPNPPVAEVYVTAARKQGVALECSEVRARFRRAFGLDERDELHGPLTTDESVEYHRWRRIVVNVLPELPNPDGAFAELWNHFACPSAWRCFPDAGPTIRSLEATGIRLRIASNFDRRLRTVVSGLPELADFSESLVISSEVGFRKPHPRFYAAACASLGLPPRRVLFVGDDPENDLRGPARAGLRGALIDRTGRHPETEPRIADLTGLLPVQQGRL